MTLLQRSSLAPATFALTAFALLAACSGSGGSSTTDTGHDGPATDLGGDQLGDVSLDEGPEPAPCGTDRVQEDIGIPTIDGYELSAFVDRPDHPDCQLPTILIQTPYNKEGVRSGLIGEREARPLLDSPQYNYVAVDWRGRFGSSGLPHAGEGPWLAQDSYDTVEWVADQPWSNGVVGMWGVSALCGAQYRTAVGPAPTDANPNFDSGPPPSLGAMVPIFCSIRSSYEHVYPGGVLRHEWAAGLDVLGFGLRAIYESNPRRNLLWDILDDAIPAERIAVPALVVAGWWDLVPNGTIASFEELVAESDPSVRGQHRLLIGPWIHFAVGGETTEGALRPLTETERSFMDLERIIDERSLAFFDHHLRGVANAVPDWAPVRYYHNVGLDEGQWNDADVWPPPEADDVTLYLHSFDQSLDVTAPTGSDETRSFDSDPSDPSPTIGGPTLSPYNCVGHPNPLVCSLTPDGERVLLHGPASQQELLERDDQLVFLTDPADSPLELVGAVRLLADVATTAPDADIAIRLVDVDEQGDFWLIGTGIQRLTARVDERTYAEVEPGQRYSIVVQLANDLAYTVPTGHRLGVIVSGSNWPLAARNPQDGAMFVSDDVANATPETFRYGFPPVEIDLQGTPTAATHTLYLDGATRLEVRSDD